MPTEVEDQVIEWHKYPKTLRAKHIQDIMERSQRKTYEFLKNPPFHVARDGREVFVSKAVFRNWFEGTNLDTINNEESRGN